MTESSRIFVTDSLDGLSSRLGRDPLAPLRGRSDCRVWEAERPPDPAELRTWASKAAGILCLLGDGIDSEFIDGCPDLRVISTCSVGVDHIDVDAATGRGIRVGHTPGVLVETTADLAFGLLLAASRRIVEADRYLRGGDWSRQSSWEIEAFVGSDLQGATLGIVGLGPIGRAVARRARGFGMRILGWSRSEGEVEGLERVDLNRLLVESDFVSVHVALTDDTRGLIDGPAVESMKEGAILINTARGGIVDEVALVKALGSGRLAAAGLDVFENEPLGEDHPLVGLSNVVLTPHIGSASLRTRARMVDLAVQNLLAGIEGRALPNCVNSDALAKRESEA